MRQKNITLLTIINLVLSTLAIIAIVWLTFNLNSTLSKLRRESRFSKKLESDLTSIMAIKDRSDMLAIRQLAMNIDPRFSESMDTTQLALTLRDHIYKKVPLKMTSSGYPFSDFFEAYQRAVINPEEGHICGGLSIAYLILLEAFGIPGRYVGIFEGTQNVPISINSHASVDVFLGGRWVALDPTFNVSFQDENGHRLGWIDVRERYLANRHMTISTDGFKIVPDRDIKKYPVSMKNLVRNLVALPARAGFGDSLVMHGLIILPTDWDGVIRYSNGEEYDTKSNANEGSLYYRLSHGILR